MKPLLLSAITFVTLLLIPQPVLACHCIEQDVPACVAFWRSDAVFVGQLNEITPGRKKSDGDVPDATLHFLVEQTFRGVNGNQVDVTTFSGTSCDLRFEKGERYLIYASREPGSMQLFAGPCTRTTALKNAIDDLNTIIAITHGAGTELLAGRFVLDHREPLAGISILAKRGSLSWGTVTDSRGGFSIVVPEAGQYTVQAEIPFVAEVLSITSDDPQAVLTNRSTSVEYEAQIEPHRCDYRQFNVYKIDHPVAARGPFPLVVPRIRVLTVSGQ